MEGGSGEAVVGVEASAAPVGGGLGVPLQLVHNTLVLGKVTDRAVGFELRDQAQPALVNNLVVALPCSGAGFGVWEEGVHSDPASVSGNAFAGLGTLYRDDLAGRWARPRRSTSSTDR